MHKQIYLIAIVLLTVSAMQAEKTVQSPAISAIALPEPKAQSELIQKPSTSSSFEGDNLEKALTLVKQWKEELAKTKKKEIQVIVDQLNTLIVILVQQIDAVKSNPLIARGLLMTRDNILNNIIFNIDANYATYLQNKKRGTSTADTRKQVRTFKELLSYLPVTYREKEITKIINEIVKKLKARSKSKKTAMAKLKQQDAVK